MLQVIVLTNILKLETHQSSDVALHLSIPHGVFEGISDPGIRFMIKTITITNNNKDQTTTTTHLEVALRCCAS